MLRSLIPTLFLFLSLLVALVHAGKKQSSPQIEKGRIVLQNAAEVSWGLYSEKGKLIAKNNAEQLNPGTHTLVKNPPSGSILWVKVNDRFIKSVLK